MRHASLFSGIGGPEVAAKMMGWENIFHCEINPFGRAILEYWFPDSESYEDITKTDFRKWRGQIDVLTGGFPCQPFSYAGRRGGANDDRYLWPEMLRVIDEVRPTWVVGENVAGITTMVEGGVLTEVGSDSSLFGEDNTIYRYGLRQSFTIERICKDLEHLGYSVQPVLIPAAAVGAPHRRDRVFIIAFDADTDRRNDLRGAGEDEGKGGEERLQERDEVREFGKSNQLRSEVFEVATDPSNNGIQGRDFKGCKGKKGERREGEFLPKPVAATCGGRPFTDSDREGREESFQPGREKDSKEDKARVHDRIERSCADGYATDTLRTRCDWKNEPRSEETHKRMHLRGNPAGYDFTDLRPEDRWENFPTVSPIHRGNDGLPFPLDNLTIPATRWRAESLKAYGNAIVPQVMYRIFQYIERVNN